MTELELFQATVSHQPHRKFLFYADFTPEVARGIREKYRLTEKTDLSEFFGMFNRTTFVNPRLSSKNQKPDFSCYFSDVEKPDGSFINSRGVLEIPARLYHFTGYISPLRNAKGFSDLEKFPYLRTTGLDEGGMKEEVEQLHRKGQVACTSITHMYEEAWQIRGYQEFLMDMVERPEWCAYILDRLLERNLARATAGARAGVDWLLTGDDVANQNSLMFSLPMWRKFIKERWAKVYAAARAIKPDIQIWYHSDGNITSIIPELIEIGVTILNPLQPECLDLVRLKKIYGEKLVFDGTIGTQSTMPFGTPDEVRQVVRERKKTLGYDGALILSPTHILEPEVPVENIEAFIEECKEN